MTSELLTLSLMKSYPQQLHIFFNALTYFTRLPAPKWVVYSAENQRQAISYITWIGLLVGIYSALIFWLSQYFLPTEVAIVLAIIASIWITGGLHEDGFADTCDGFGGGWNPQQIIEIMKDSRIGSYGAIGLCCILLLKFSTLNHVALVPLTLIIGHTLSRFPALMIMSRAPYIGMVDQSKSYALIQPVPPSSYLIAVTPIILVFCFTPLSFIGLVIPVLCLAFWLTRYFKQQLGGYNGDCLGASQQLSEALIYLCLCLPLYL